MIDSMDVLGAIALKLKEAFPEATIYDDFKPDKFKRPCFYVEYVTTTTRAGNYTTIEMTDYFTITYYGKRNSYQRVDKREQMKCQRDTLQLFLVGYLIVKDRAPKVTASTAGYDDEAAYIELQITYREDRPITIEELPDIESIEGSIELQKGL